MGGFTTPGVQEYHAPHLQQAMDWFNQREQTPAQQAQVPNMPLHQQAGRQAAMSVRDMGPDMQKFFHGMMAHGGMPDITSTLSQMQGLGDIDRTRTTQAITGAMAPGSTAQTRALAGSLTEADLQRQLAMSGLGLQAQQMAMGNQFAGAQGLAGMPGYYSGPSSIEASMLGLRQPYDLSNLQARIQRDNVMDNWMQNLGFYQPERIQTPSPFDQWVAPWLNPLMQGAAGAIIPSPGGG